MVIEKAGSPAAKAATVGATASVSEWVNAPCSNSALISGTAMTISATVAGNVRNSDSSMARFWLVIAPCSLPALSLRDRSGSSTTPMATPMTPSGS